MMKAVILAAGAGVRLRPMTVKIPKALIEIGGQTLIERSLDQLQACGLKDIYIVTGYLGGLIRQKIGYTYKGLNIVYVDNPNYAHTGSMYSLSQLQPMLDDDIVLLESDLLYEDRALRLIIDSRFDDAILIADLLNEGDDVYVSANENNQVIYLGKVLLEVYRPLVTGCLVGISKYSFSFMQQLFATAKEDYASGHLTAHYEECVLHTSRRHKPVYAVYAENLTWTEIDTQRDLQNARQAVYPRLQS